MQEKIQIKGYKGVRNLASNNTSLKESCVLSSVFNYPLTGIQNKRVSLANISIKVLELTFTCNKDICKHKYSCSM